MMKSRLLHNIVLALIVAGLALFLVFKPQKAGPQKFALSTLQATGVTRLDLTPAGKAPIVLEKHGGDWRMTAPLQARADRFRIDSLLEILGAQSETRLPATDLGRFGLAKPFARLVARQGAAEQVFDFGDRQPVSNQLYVATGGQVYLVSPVYLVDMSKGAEDFLSRKLLADAESPVAFELPGLKLALKDGTWTREPNEGPRSPDLKNLSADQLNRFVDEWKLAMAMSVAKAGTGKALAQVRVRLSNGRTLELSLLEREPEVVLRREDEGLEYHFAADAGARLLDPSRLDPPRIDPGRPDSGKPEPAGPDARRP